MFPVGQKGESTGGVGIPESDEDEGRCGPAVVFCIRHHLLGQVLSNFKDTFGLSFQLERTTLCSPC